MVIARIARLLPLGLAYFAAVFLCVSLTRYDGGAAYLWFASAILIADLSSRPASEWPDRLAICTVAGVLAVGFGTGSWLRSMPISIGSLAEAVIGAALLRRREWRQAPGTLSWLLRFSVSVGLAAPLIGAAIIAFASGIDHRAFLATFRTAFVAHAMSNLAFAPLLRMLMRGGWKSFFGDLGQHGTISAISLFTTVTLVTAGVFYQSDRPLLFIPVLPVVLTAFRLGYAGATVSVLVVALVGGALTLGGYGPIHLIHGNLGERLQFFLFYLASLSLIALPIAADLDLRGELLRSAQINEARYRLLADYSTDIMMHIDASGQVLYASPAIDRFIDFDRSALRNAEHVTFIEVEDMPLVRQGHADTIAARGETVSFEYRAITRDGERRWLEAHSRAIVHDDGSTAGVITVLRDVSDRKANEAQLSRDAMTDPLTGLANRRGFEAEVGRWLKQRAIGQADCIAVFDIDHFKRVNDGHGHAAGDAVLQVFARVLRNVVRQGDAVARIGGEEFAAHFPATSVDQALAICERLRTEMSRQTTITGGEPIRVTVSGGVASFTDEGLARALKQADQALYAAKRGGRDQMALAA